MIRRFVLKFHYNQVLQALTLEIGYCTSPNEIVRLCAGALRIEHLVKRAEVTMTLSKWAMAAVHAGCSNSCPVERLKDEQPMFLPPK